MVFDHDEEGRILAREVKGSSDVEMSSSNNNNISANSGGNAECGTDFVVARNTLLLLLRRRHQLLLPRVALRLLQELRRIILAPQKTMIRCRRIEWTEINNNG